MDTLPLRLAPGDDLRRTLEAALGGTGVHAGFVLAGIGSLSRACIRLAGASDAPPQDGPFELLTLAGTIADGASHLHASLARSDGTLFGGHVAYGCCVQTTAEVLVGLLPAWRFSREADQATGYAELVIRRA